MDQASCMASWRDLLARYYDGCTQGNVPLMMQTLDPEVVHWFLAPNVGSRPVRGAEHLARYWRKVARMIEGRWVIDHLCAMEQQAVIEWTMFWRPPGKDERVATRGCEWFTLRDGRIVEIRSYYQQRPETSELDGFPYAQRGYSVPGAERSALHSPDPGSSPG
jgi:ketosteroid isomerase-like protein